MLNTKTLFLINDQKSQIFEFQIVTQHPVGSDHDIYQTFFRIFNSLLLLCRSSKSAHKIHSHRKIPHTLLECMIMLLCKNRCRHKIYNLLTLLHRLKGCTNCNLSLTVSHISADQTIHNLRAFHIALYCFDCKKLIFGLFERKHFLKFLLPDSIFPIDKPLLILSCRV